MYPGRLSSFVLAFVALISGCDTQPAPEASAITQIVLDASVQVSVRSLLKDYRPPVSMVSSAETREVNDRRGSGPVTHKTHGTNSRLSSGLWGSIGGGRSDRPDSASGGHALHLCGLAVLASMTTPGSAAVPGGAFLPFGIRTSADVSLRKRVMRFETAAERLCAPQPGTAFSYRAESELWIRVPSLPEGGLATRSSSETSCKVAAEVRPAGNFGLPLHGDALSVSCESPGRSGTILTTEYAFIRDLGLYFLLSGGDAGEVPTIKVSYDSIEYR